MTLPGNRNPDDPFHPAGVPAEAYWDAKDNEWVLPQRNARGEFHGVVTWYRPDGTRCCVTDHVDGKPHGTFTRYHENGEPSRTGTFVRGTLHGVNVFTRSTAPTSENFPSGLGKHIWRCEMEFVDGRMTEGRLFDREGRRVMEDGTPFPTERPAGVPASAFFRKPEGSDDYCWVAGENQLVEGGGAWKRVGTWRYWSPEGVLVCEEPYVDGALHGILRKFDADTGALVEEQRYEHGERRFDRPAGVPAEATFDEDDERWTVAAPEVDGRAHGDERAWDAAGRLRLVETYASGELVRLREYLADGSLGQDSELFDGGVPRRKWFRKTEDEELDSFPNVTGEAREVEYLFDEHGRMASYRITGEGGAELEHEELYRNARGDEPQARFATVEEASAAWIAAGDHYTSELNRWLAELYASEDGETSFEEPTFERRDLERGVIDGVVELTARGEGARVRSLFPLYFDGIGKELWDRYGLVVDHVVETGPAAEPTILARVIHPVRGPEVVRITRERIEPLAGVLGFGGSADKRYVALAYDDRIEIEHGGERIALSYPDAYQHAGADALPKRLGRGRPMGVADVRVLADGATVLLVTAEGTYVVGRGGAQRLYPLDATLDEYVAAYEEAGAADGTIFELEVHFANADLAPAGDRITCGGMFRRGIMAGLAMFRRDGATWRLENTSQADAFFPAQAVFHRTRPHVAFAATLYASLHNALTNTTFRIDLEGLAPGEIDEFGGGIAREHGRVQAIASFGDGFLLGFDNGYVRWMGVEDNLQLLGYVYVGGSVHSIDVGADGRSFVVGTDAGFVARFRLGDSASRNLITTMPLVDEGRVVFLRTFPPLRW